MRPTLEDAMGFKFEWQSGRINTMRSVLTTDLTLNENSSPAYMLDPGGSSKNVTLPALRAGLWFLVAHVGASSGLTVRRADLVTVASLTAGQMGLFLCSGLEWRSIVPTAGGGSGDVVGPASALDRSIALYDGTTGKLLKDAVALGTLGHPLLSAGGAADPAFGQVDTAGIANNGVTNAKLADMAAWTVKVRNAGTSGDPSDADSAALTTGTPASGDFLMGWESTGELRKFDVGALPTGGAPVGSSYVVIALDGTLTAERNLVAGGGLTLTDGGANAAATLAVGAGTGLTVNADDVAISANGVTNTLLADMGAWTVKVRNAGTSGDPSDADSAALTAGTPASGDFLLGWESTGELRKFDVGALPSGGGAPVGSSYVVIALDGTLTAERNLAVSAALSLTDGGANAAVTLGRAAFTGDVTAAADSNTLTTVKASTTEVLTGTDTAKVVTADALAALWEKGADEASAATVSFGEGGFFHITGTTTITDIDWDTAKDGRRVWVVFDGALTLTHNATTLVLPSGANITTAAGDRALFVQDAADNVICLAYIRADGTALVGGGGGGDNISVNGVAAADADFDDATPAAPANAVNVTWQKDASTPNNVSGHIVGSTATNRGVVELATDAEAEAGTDTARAVTPANLAAAVIMQGKHGEFYPATLFIPRITAGPSVSVTETTTNDSMLSTLDFDQTTQEGATAIVKPPRKWDLSTITFRHLWTADAGTGTFELELDAVALSDDDVIDAAWGTAVGVSDTLLATGDMHISAESSAVTIAGTPTLGDAVAIRIKRDVANDTLTADARLIGVEVFWGLTSPTDA